ncbi:Aste57867_10321 [Aphanomyces stellatus]|uniref:Aste57867_10321 protein n=1 Tax=Aphanomyces stellatus TaxID=120398 RepID=A0A485KR00_9STRA|nr:hypothetical protein As57867_010281 [Aphanomyces stellatus]VFT87195.1 Aste57867_10321 [Aphanomyces stellatus]
MQSAAATQVLLTSSLVTQVVSFQDGLFLDLRRRFAEAKHIITCSLGFGTSHLYVLPPSFRAVPGALDQSRLPASSLMLHADHVDIRLPLHLAIVEGELGIVTRILACRPAWLTADALHCAVLHSRVDIVEHLVNLERCRRGPDDHVLFSSLPARCGSEAYAIDVAAASSTLEMVAFLHEHKVGTCSPSAMDEAAKRGHLAMVHYLHDHRDEGCTTAAMDFAAAYGHVEVAQFLHVHRPEGCSPYTLSTAAVHDQVEMVRFLLANYPWSAMRVVGACNSAANKFNVVDYLRHEIPRDAPGIEECVASMNHDALLGFVCKTSNLDLLQWVVEDRGVPLKLTKLLATDNLLVVEYLLAMAPQVVNCICPTTIQVAQSMLTKGHVIETGSLNLLCQSNQNQTVLQYIHEMCPEANFTPDAIDTAAAFGQLEIVRFLHQTRTEGCTTAAMDMAAANGFDDVVRFLHENRTEGCTTKAMDQAARNGHLETLQFLHLHRHEGCTTQALDDAASYSGRLDIVQFLHENRHEGCTSKAMEGACCRFPAIVEYLLAHRSEGCTPQALVNAVENGWLQIVQCLLQHCPELDDTQAMVAAAKRGFVAAMKLLVSHRETCTLKASWKECIAAAMNGRAYFAIEWLWKTLADIQSRDERVGLAITLLEWSPGSSWGEAPCAWKPWPTIRSQVALDRSNLVTGTSGP